MLHLKVKTTVAVAMAAAVNSAAALGGGRNVGIKSGGRHGAYSRKAAAGPHMKLLAATYFGSRGCEEFVDVGTLPDGTIVAFGNAWGPAFPHSPAPVILGRGKHTGQPAMARGRRGRRVPNRKSPDMAGIIVFYSSGLRRIKKVIKLDWGVAGIEAGLVAGDGKGLVVAGRCQAGFRSFSQLARSVKRLPYGPARPDPRRRTRRRRQPDPAVLCDVYVARLSATGRPEWVWVLEKNNDPPEAIFTDNTGAVYFDANGLHRISPGGGELKLVSTRTGTGQAKWLGVDPNDGTAYYGGDRNTGTGREPWRQPYLYKIDAEGKIVWRLWEFNPREIGGDDCRLVSDSSVRALAFSKDGELLIGGWSDGGNSVFPRQATDWRKRAKGGGMGMETSGMRGANSLAHIMRIDPRTRETKMHAWWACFLPTWFASPRHRGAPNFANIQQMKVLDDGSLAITGSAATGLIQTPGAFWQDPMTGEKHGGEYVAVFRPDLSNLKFSSYLPGCEGVSLGTWRNGVVVVSRSTGTDGRPPKATPSPVRNAIQKGFRGGTDAHIILLENP